MEIQFKVVNANGHNNYCRESSTVTQCNYILAPSYSIGIQVTIFKALALAVYQCLESLENIQQGPKPLPLPVLGQQTQPTMGHTLSRQPQLTTRPNACPGSILQGHLKHRHVLELLCEFTCVH